MQIVKPTLYNSTKLKECIIIFLQTLKSTRENFCNFVLGYFKLVTSKGIAIRVPGVEKYFGKIFSLKKNVCPFQPSFEITLLQSIPQQLVSVARRSKPLTMS